MHTTPLHTDSPAQTAASVKRTAGLVAFAAALQMMESMIPHPVPGARLGLANVIVLVVLVDLGVRQALEIALLRTVVAAILMGTFLTPPFFLSLCAALASTAAMAAAFRLLTRRSVPVLSLMGVSLLGAAVHNLVQICMAYVLVVRHTGIFLLLPWLGIASVVSGWITGMVASAVCKRLASGQKFAIPPTANAEFGAGSSRITPETVSRPRLFGTLSVGSKLALVLVPAVAAIVLSNHRVLAGLALLVISMALLAGLRLRVLIARLLRMSGFFVVSFLIPVLLTRTGDSVFLHPPLLITRQGLALGASVVLRLLILVAATALLAHITDKTEFLRWLNSSGRGRRQVISGRLVAIIAVAIEDFDELWSISRSAFVPGKNPGEKRGGIQSLSDRISAIYCSLSNQDSMAGGKNSEGEGDSK